MSKLKLSLKARIDDKSNVIAKLEIENLSDQDCYIGKDTIMLDGFKNDKFKIFTADNEEAIYLGRLVKYYPDSIILKAHENMVNELNLSNIYEIPESSEYNINYTTYVNCCSDKDNKSCSNTEFNVNDSVMVDIAGNANFNGDE